MFPIAHPDTLTYGNNMRVETYLSESDGSTCPRGWYFFVECFDAPDAPPLQARGPFNSMAAAGNARDRFLRLIGATQPLYGPKAGPVINKLPVAELPNDPLAGIGATRDDMQEFAPGAGGHDADDPLSLGATLRKSQN